jgi:hypothetical protein
MGEAWQSKLKKNTSIYLTAFCEIIEGVGGLKEWGWMR